jgi:antitoxin component YwqK of YwqJK toxin-antitoxin module
LREGKSEYWNGNGKKIAELHWKAGELDGEQFHWSDEGYLEFHAVFDNGKRVSAEFWQSENFKRRAETYRKGFIAEATDWDSLGRPQRIQQYDTAGALLKTFVYYYDAQGKLKAKIEYDLNGKRNGEMLEYYRTGKLMRQSFYKNGKLEGVMTEWYENGIKSLEAEYHNDLRDGNQTEYSEQGNKTTVIHYSQGVLSGETTHWYETGELKMKTVVYPSKDSVQTITFFHKNGQVQQVIHYQHGIISDDRIDSFDENGQLVQSDFYSNGKRTRSDYFEKGKLVRSANY